MQTDTIWIDNLKCSGCANSINKAVRSMTGILNVKIDVDKSSVTYEHTAEADKEAIIQKLSKMGYPVQGTSTFGQKAKSYVSCAIGRLG